MTRKKRNPVAKALRVVGQPKVIDDKRRVLVERAERLDIEQERE